MHSEFGDDKKSSGNSDDNYTTEWMCLMPLNCTLKMVDIYVTYILPQ